MHVNGNESGALWSATSVPPSNGMEPDEMDWNEQKGRLNVFVQVVQGPV